MEEHKEPLNIETGEIELPKFDLTPYIGQRVKIASADVFKGKVFEGKQSYYALVKTESIAKIGVEDLTASRLFNLRVDVDGNVGWGPNMPLAVFLAKLKCKTLKSCIGKLVIIQKEVKKDGREFLSLEA